MTVIVARQSAMADKETVLNRERNPSVYFLT